MKSLKIKLATAFIMVAFAIAMLIVGIYAAQTQTITMQGSVNFEIADKSLYMKDVRIQMDNSSDSTSIDDFMPGYINGNFKMNLGSLTNNYGSFALYFDIVNTIDEETQESFYYSPSVTCEQSVVASFPPTKELYVVPRLLACSKFINHFLVCAFAFRFAFSRKKM